jgi:lysophospholipid acyltransferase (LPLAT)-like uncharacterized protein
VATEWDRGAGRDARRERATERAAITEHRRKAGRDAAWRRGLRMLRRGLGRVATTSLVPAAIGALARTWRVERIDQHHFDTLSAAGPFVAVMWHGGMLLPLRVHRDRGVAVLVSPSGDGELVARILRRFGYRVVRGSSSRYGARSLRDLADELRAGTPVVITPDGPRGPRHAMNVGAAWLARETGAPILPAACCVDRAWRLSSWDRFAIPKPGARVMICYGAPVTVDRNADDADLEAVSADLRDWLLANERAAANRLGVAFDA